MRGPERLLPQCQGPLVEGLRLRIAPLIIVELGQVVEAGGDVGVLGAQHALPDDEGTLIGALRPGIVTNAIQGLPECGLKACRPHLLPRLPGLYHSPEVWEQSQ